MVFDPVSYLLFITAFEFAITFWIWLKTSLFQDYTLGCTLDNDTPNGDNGINDNDNDDENYINDNKADNDRNNHNDYNDDDNDNNYVNDNGDQTITIFQAMHLGEPVL